MDTNATNMTGREGVTGNCTASFDVSSLGWFTSRSILAYVQLALNSLGVLGNLALLLFLSRSPLGSKMATIFFMHQAYLDACVNFMSALIAVQPQKWRLGWWDPLDNLICRMWHTQFIFWLFVQLSVVNLVLIGLERFWAVVHPIYYAKVKSRRQSAICLLVSAVYNCIYVVPQFLERRFLYECGEPRCVGRSKDPLTGTIMAAYSVMWVTSYYFVALILMIIFYGRVIYQLKQAKKISSSQTKDKRTQATQQFTKAVIIITILFIVCMSLDAAAYILSRFGLITYVNGTWIHQMGMFSVSLNSFANPFIYFWIVMRKSFLAKICPSWYRKKPTSQSVRSTDIN